MRLISLLLDATDEDEMHRFQEIQAKFQDFTKSVSLNSEMYNRADRFAKDLVAEGHTETVTIKDEQDILRLFEVVLCFISLQVCRKTASACSHL